MIELEPTVLAFLVGSVVPLLVALLTKLKASPRVKAAANLVVSIVAGVVTFLSTTNGRATFLELAGAAIAAYLASGVAYHNFWKPTGVAPVVNRSTPKLGIG